MYPALWHRLLQVVRCVADGSRPPIPAVDEIPGRDTASFGGLGDYLALIERCWAQEAEERPAFPDIIEALR